MKVKLPGLGVLTTEHSASSYGLPVLLIGGEAYGPHDILPGGRRADRAYAAWRKGRTDEECVQIDKAATKWLSQAPPD